MVTKVKANKLLEVMTPSAKVEERDYLYDNLGFIVGLRLVLRDGNGKDFIFTMKEDDIILMDDGIDEEE